MPIRILSVNILCCIIFFSACSEDIAADNNTVPAVKEETLIVCPDERSKVCTREFNPVCAKRDTGVRCVTTPCPSTEWVTKGNPCSACSDASIEGYIMGECQVSGSQEP